MPELDHYQHEMYYHWCELNTCRFPFEIERPIPWTAIKDYAYSFVGISNLDDFEDFLAIIRYIDNYYIDWMYQKRQKEMEKQQKDLELKSRQGRRR